MGFCFPFIKDACYEKYLISPLSCSLYSMLCYNIEIYNAIGQKVMAQKRSLTQNKIILQTSSLTNGIYILRITDGSSKLTKKIVINH